MTLRGRIGKLEGATSEALGAAYARLWSCLTAEEKEVLGGLKLEARDLSPEAHTENRNWQYPNSQPHIGYKTWRVSFLAFAKGNTANTFTTIIPHWA
jgi:hypothetical protein